MPGTLTVRLLKIEGLEGEDGLGKNDIYIKVEIGAESYKSKVYKNAGRSEDLDDVFTFKISGMEEKIRNLDVKVYDKDMLDSDKLAEGEVAVREVIETNQLCLKLEDRGRLTMAFTWQPE